MTTSVMSEINDDQLRLIQNIANSQYNRVVFVQPDAALDEPDFFAGLFESHKNLDHLLSLGLLKEVTEDAKDLLDALAAPDAANNRPPRVYRVIKITKEGQMMFDLSFSDNRPN